MTSEELAEEVEKVVARCRERITGIGNEQYSLPSGLQDFELRSFDELLQMYLEEIEDGINHLVMLHIRFTRILTFRPSP